MTDPEQFPQRGLLAWSAGGWTHPPVSASEDGTDLLVEAAEGSDAWRRTAYGFIHESEHALLAPLAVGSAMEVTVTADLPKQFDQAGLFIRVNGETWIKAGLERSDGRLQLGAVVTFGQSDWSVAPVDGWDGRQVTVRVSRTADALIIRAGLAGEEQQLVRVVPFDAGQPAAAGPYACAPTRAGLTVRFSSWTVTDADTSLH